MREYAASFKWKHIYRTLESALLSGWYFLPSMVFIFTSWVTTPLSFEYVPLSDNVPLSVDISSFDSAMEGDLMKLSLEKSTTTSNR